MADPNPPQPDPDENPADNNPFRGTPFEQMFGAMGSGQVDLSTIFNQMQQLFAPHEGSVNFDVAKDVARRTSATVGEDPVPLTIVEGAISDAVRLGESWLDQVTEIPAGATTSTAWSRADWIEGTADDFKQLVEPIASHMVSAMSTAIPEEAKAMAGPLLGMLNQAGSAMFSQQVGRAIGELSSEVLSASDIGIPIGPARTVAIVPTNVTAFSAGLNQSKADVLLYVVLRECAHQRLFAHSPWLRSSLETAIEEFGRGTTIDVSAIESALGGIDPSRPDQIQEAFNNGFFEPQRTPEQQRALDRLETLLAFVEGWVDEVVGQATAGKMPAAISLGEAMRRRRASGGPAEQTFASLVGLELRPRRLREAATLWAAVRDRKGAHARDIPWTHPDLMPTRIDLDDPMGFATGERAKTDTDSAESSVDFDAELSRLLGETDLSSTRRDEAADSAEDDETGDEGDSDTGSSEPGQRD